MIVAHLPLIPQQVLPTEAKQIPPHTLIDLLLVAQKQTFEAARLHSSPLLLVAAVDFPLAPLMLGTETVRGNAKEIANGMSAPLPSHIEVGMMTGQIGLDATASLAALIEA
jgi:hypothetical protein